MIKTNNFTIKPDFSKVKILHCTEGYYTTLSGEPLGNVIYQYLECFDENGFLLPMSKWKFSSYDDYYYWHTYNEVIKVSTRK